MAPESSCPTLSSIVRGSSFVRMKVHFEKLQPQSHPMVVLKLLVVCKKQHFPGALFPSMIPKPTK